MEILTFSRFKTPKRLTPEQIETLEVLSIIDAGGIPEQIYFYHFPSSEISNVEKEVLLEKYGLEFVETRRYTLEHKFSRWVPKPQRTS